MKCKRCGLETGGFRHMNVNNCWTAASNKLAEQGMQMPDMHGLNAYEGLHEMLDMLNQNSVSESQPEPTPFAMENDPLSETAETAVVFDKEAVEEAEAITEDAASDDDLSDEDE